MANLIDMSEKIVQMAARNKSVPLTKRGIKQVMLIYGLSKKQSKFYLKELLLGRDAKAVFGDANPFSHEALEYAHSLLESYL